MYEWNESCRPYLWMKWSPDTYLWMKWVTWHRSRVSITSCMSHTCIFDIPPTSIHAILIKKARGTLDLPQFKAVEQTLYNATVPIKKSILDISHTSIHDTHPFMTHIHSRHMSRHTYPWMKWMSHVTQIGWYEGSCHTWMGCVMSHICVKWNKSCRVYWMMSWVTSWMTGMSHVTHIQLWYQACHAHTHIHTHTHTHTHTLHDTCHARTYSKRACSFEEVCVCVTWMILCVWDMNMMCVPHLNDYLRVWHAWWMAYGVSTLSRHLKIEGLFGNRALEKRLYSTKETYNSKKPTNRSLLITVWARHTMG